MEGQWKAVDGRRKVGKKEAEGRGRCRFDLGERTGHLSLERRLRLRRTRLMTRAVSGDSAGRKGCSKGVLKRCSRVTQDMPQGSLSRGDQKRLRNTQKHSEPLKITHQPLGRLTKLATDTARHAACVGRHLHTTEEAIKGDQRHSNADERRWQPEIGNQRHSIGTTAGNQRQQSKKKRCPLLGLRV